MRRPTAGKRAKRGGLKGTGRDAASVWAVLWLAALLLALRPIFAHAEPVEPAKEQAHSSLREGNVLLERGRPVEALRKFAEAYRLFPSPKLHYNMGQAQSQIPGHEPEAYDEMSRFLSEAKDANAKLREA